MYDTLGTVLYCTVPVSTTAEEHFPQDLGDAQNIPLDYETALMMLEAEQAQAVHGATANGGTALAGSIGQNGRAATRSAGRLSVTAADTRLPTATAASSLNASGIFSAPSPPQQQRVGFSTMSTRYGASVSSPQRVVGMSSKVGGAGSGSAARRNSRVVGFDGAAAALPESVAVRNAYVAKAASARIAAAATQAASENLNGLSKTVAAAPAAAVAARLNGGRALTVADAMAVLFPITPVAMVEGSGPDEGDDAVGQVSNGTSRGASSLSSAVHRSVSIAATDRSRHTGDGTERGTHEAPLSKALPRLWRRADVGHVSRLDVVLLYLHLQHRCATESARPRGVVCPNRERLYGDTLQELTRQVTLLCPERGLLLDELARSMQQASETYDVLLDSASQYAVRKSTERDLHQHLFAEKAELETEVRRREHRVSEWRAKYAGLQKRFEEQQAADEKLHEQEISYAKRANTQLVSEIKRLASEAEKAKEA